MNLKWFAIGLTGGAVIGSVVTILSTPRTGAEMRQKIKNGIDDVRRSAARKVNDEHYTIADVISEV